jgi:hypothetical protein
MISGWLGGHRLEGWTKLFLITTILTSVTGFGFPFHGFTSAIGVGIILLVVLAIAVYAPPPAATPRGMALGLFRPSSL